MKKKSNKNNTVRSFLGMPMRWEHRKALKNMWNKAEDRVFPPKYFGIGWDINFYALLKKTKVIRPKPKKRN